MTGLKRLQNDMELVILLSMFEDDIQSFVPPISGVAEAGVSAGGGGDTLKHSIDAIRGKLYFKSKILKLFFGFCFWNFKNLLI